MAGLSNLRKQQRVTIVRQLVALNRLAPQGENYSSSRDALDWRCWVRPTPLGNDYLLRIRYKLSHSPSAFILEPDLRALAGGNDLLHVYSQEKQCICLFLPWTNEWQSCFYLANTVYPWSLSWLLYFEDWLLTGKWNGGGVHPNSGEKTPGKDS